MILNKYTKDKISRPDFNKVDLFDRIKDAGFEYPSPRYNKDDYETKDDENDKNDENDDDDKNYIDFDDVKISYYVTFGEFKLGTGIHILNLHISPYGTSGANPFISHNLNKEFHNETDIIDEIIVYKDRILLVFGVGYGAKINSPPSEVFISEITLYPKWRKSNSKSYKKKEMKSKQKKNCVIL